MPQISTWISDEETLLKYEFGNQSLTVERRNMEIKELQMNLQSFLIKYLQKVVTFFKYVTLFIKNIPQTFVVKVILVAVLLFILAAFCSLQDAKDVPLSQIDKALQKETRIEQMENCNERQLMQFIGIDASVYDSFIYYKSKKALGVEELLIVKANDKGDLDSALDAVESRIDNQIKTFEGYGQEQVALLNKAIVTQRGDYLFYCVDNSPEKYEEVFNRAV